MEAKKPKNIYIIGAQSTGKTTIVNALEAALEREERQETDTTDSIAPEASSTDPSTLQRPNDNTEGGDGWWQRGGRAKAKKPKIIRELARTVLKNLNVTRDYLTSDTESAETIQRHILHAQYKAEKDILASDEGTWFISDRSGADTLVYASMFAGEAAVQRLLASQEWLELETRMKEGIVFVCEAGTTWLHDDGVRYMPTNLDDWNRVDATFRAILARRDISYVVIPNVLENLQDRVDLVKRTWQR